MERVDPLVVGLLLVVAVLVVSQIIEATFGEGGAAPSVDGAAPRFRRRLGGLWRRATPDRVVETLAIVLRLSPILGLALLVWAVLLDEPPTTETGGVPLFDLADESDEPDQTGPLALAPPETPPRFAAAPTSPSTPAPTTTPAAIALAPSGPDDDGPPPSEESSI